MIILALAIVIVVLIGVSSTAAWYIRTKSDSADIVLSNPVNIEIAEFDSNNKFTRVKDILESYNNRIYPGDRIKLNLGMILGTSNETSSSAYVRVKLNMAFSKISDDPNESDITLETLAGQNLIEYENEPDATKWKLVDFNKFTYVEGEDYTPDYWYVYKIDNATNGTVARVAQDGDEIPFLNGYIKLSKTNITNAQANHKFHIVYTVEAIQTVNVPNPLQYEGYGPWWNYINGDNEDIPGWKSET